MAATTISRTALNALADDDGTNNTGSIWNKAAIGSVIHDAIDDLLANNLELGGALTLPQMTLNQGGADTALLTLKSSDVAHGVTGEAETDVFGLWRKANADAGGLGLATFTEGATSHSHEAIATTDTTTKSTGATAYLYWNGRKKNGTGVTDMGANANIAAFANNGTTRFILDADGDSHQDVGTAWTNFDTHDDVAVLEAVAVALARDGDPLRATFVSELERHRELIESLPGKALVAFAADGHHFVNMSRLTMLLTGAVRQVAHRLATVEQRVLAGEA